MTAPTPVTLAATLNLPSGMLFPRLRRRFTQEMVNRYGRVNDDHNLIHYDAEAARRAGFPRPIVHGALVAALLSEACRDCFGRDWLEHGKLKVAFIKPLLVDQAVTTGATVAAGATTAAGATIIGGATRVGGAVRVGGATLVGGAADPDGGRIRLDVWCENEAGERVLAGEASCVPPEA